MSHVAIHKWIKKYVGLMGAYLDKITPNVADAWRVDELYLKVRGIQNICMLSWMTR